MMIKILRTSLYGALLALVIAVPASAQDTPRFVSVIDDLPLMSGLNETGEGVAFSTPQGRLAETTASGTATDGLTRKAVLDFYAKTLPQLGWRRAGEVRFVREDESLDIEVTESAGVLRVRFSLAPTD